MSQFYIDNEKDLLRCHNSMETQWPLLITGMTIDGHRKTFRGTVQSIDEATDPEDASTSKLRFTAENDGAAKARRWRIGLSGDQK